MLLFTCLAGITPTPRLGQYQAGNRMFFLIAYLFATVPVQAQDCPNYVEYARERHPPFSSGVYEFPFQRPVEECRTFIVDEIEQVIANMSEIIVDPDLYRLFVNTWPSTVDTTVGWTGFAQDNSEEEVRSCTEATSQNLARERLID